VVLLPVELQEVQTLRILEKLNLSFFPASILLRHPVRRSVFGKFLWIESFLDSSRVRSYNQSIGNVPLIEPVIEASKELQRIKSKKGWFLSVRVCSVFWENTSKMKTGFRGWPLQPSIAHVTTAFTPTPSTTRFWKMNL